MLDKDFKPKLSDFGLAREGPTEGRTHVTTAVFFPLLNFLYKKTLMDSLAIIQVTNLSLSQSLVCASVYEISLKFDIFCTIECVFNRL